MSGRNFSVRDVFRKQNKKSKDIERWLGNKVEKKKAHWWRKSVDKEDEECWFTMEVCWQGKLID